MFRSEVSISSYLPIAVYCPPFSLSDPISPVVAPYLKELFEASKFAPGLVRFAAKLAAGPTTGREVMRFWCTERSPKLCISRVRFGDVLPEGLFWALSLVLQGVRVAHVFSASDDAASAPEPVGAFSPDALEPAASRFPNVPMTPLLPHMLSAPMMPCFHAGFWYEVPMGCEGLSVPFGMAKVLNRLGRLAVAIVVEGLWEVPEVIEESEAQAESWDEKDAVVCHARGGGCWRASTDSRSDSNEVRGTVCSCIQTKVVDAITRRSGRKEVGACAVEFRFL